MNSMNNVAISVLLNDTILQANGLCRFTYIPTGKKYLIYNLNEKSLQNGKELNKVYVSETGDKGSEFIQISQDDWSAIKTIMSDLGVQNAEPPTNIQLAELQPTQYIVGPYKKIAINDELMSNILNNQLAKQPKENIPTPTGNAEFFDPSLKEDVSVVSEQVEQVPNAFNMAAPEVNPEDLAPTTLVQPVVTQEVQTQPVETPVQTAPVQAAPVQAVPVETAPVQPVETPVQVNAVQIVPQDDEKAKVVEALKVFLNYVGADMNKVDSILNLSNVVSTPQVEEKKDENLIDINNLPVAPQEPVAEDNVLKEETFEPTTPSMPVDTMVSSVPLPQTEVTPAPTEVQTITQPVETPQIIQPVETPQSAPTVSVDATQQIDTVTITDPTVPQQPIVEEPVPAPTAVVEQPVEVVQPTVLVQPVAEVSTPQEEQVVMEPSIPVDAIDTNIQESAPANSNDAEYQAITNNTELIQPITTEIEPVQTELVAPTEVAPPNPVQADTVQLTQVNLNAVPDIDLSNVQEGEATSPQDNMSFLAAGDVVVPDNQQNTGAVGLPGDSGAKILEKVA